MRFKGNIILLMLLFRIFRIEAKPDIVNNQDTVFLTIPTAEQRFASKNLSLLINKFNIDIAKDNMLQAKLWFNPNINYGTTLYNSESHKYFDDFYPTSSYSDENFQIQQLLTLGGRYRATWKLAEVGIKEARYQLEDLIRNLKYELYTDMSDLYYNQQLIKIYREEESDIKHMLEVTKELNMHGDAPGNEITQLQAELQDAVALEITSLKSIMNDEQDLKILLRYPGNTHFVVNELAMPPSDINQLPTFSAAIDSAEKNRPDLKLSFAEEEYANKNLKLQRASGMPDFTLGAVVVGTNSSSSAGYTGIFGSMDIPIFNRNQWNIQAAKHQINQAIINDTLTLNTVRNQVSGAYYAMIRANNELNKIDEKFGKNYENELDEMMKNAVFNYERRNINLIMLLSIINTYVDGKTNLLNLYVKYYNTVKKLNLTTATELDKH